MEDRWAVPVLDARAGRSGRALRRPAARTPSGGGLLRGAARRLRRARGCLDRARAARDRRAARRRRLGAAPTRASSSRSSPSARRSSPTSRRSAPRSAARRCCRSSSAAIALVCAFAAQWRIAAFAVFVLVVESATYRVTSLAVPRDRPDVQAARGPSRRRELPLRSHGRRDRGLRRPGAAAHVARSPPAAAHRRLGGRDRRSRCFVAASRMYRGMHHPLDVAGGLVVGVGALLVLLFACRAAGVAQAPRTPQPRAGATARRRSRSHEGRRRRPRREDARRRAAGAAPRARSARASTIRSGTRCRRPSGRPTQVRRALDEGADLVFAWGGDGTVRRCIGVLAGSTASLAVLPAGTANLSRPTSGSRRTSSEPSPSGCAATAGASTSGASTTSASRSWPAPGSTPR